MKYQATTTVHLGNWYAAAAAAAVTFGLAGAGHEAEAAQVVVHPAGGPITAPLGPASEGSAGAIYFNLFDRTGSKAGTIIPYSTPPSSANFLIVWRRTSSGFNPQVIAEGEPGRAIVLTTGSSSFYPYAAKLHKHAPINGAAFDFGSRAAEEALVGSSFSGAQYGKWKPSHYGYLGLAVFSSSNITFGWAKIHLGTGSNAYDPTLLAWGFNDDPGQTAYAGGTPAPEPSSLLLLASGAAGLAVYRRRRAQRKAAIA